MYGAHNQLSIYPNMPHIFHGNLQDIVHWKAYISPSGLDTDASVSMCAGLSLVSFKEAIMQTLGASVLRFAVLLVHITKYATSFLHTFK